MIELFKFKLSNQIYMLEYKDNNDLASSFLRFQEYYESPKFQGRIFTLGQYKAWYIKKFGKFSYYEDWDGFDIPGHVLKPFYQGKFNPLTKKEKEILQIFRAIKTPFYIIGVSLKKNLHLFKEEIKHELAHAMFYVDAAYKREVLSLLKKHNVSLIKEAIEKNIDYASRVVDDEMQAYIIADPEDLNCKIPTALKVSLNGLYTKHSKKINLEIIG